MIVAGALASGSSGSIQQLRVLSTLLRSDIWNRWVGIAQRRALIWWQQRRVPPGVAARFTVAGAKFYGFGPRLRKPSLIPPYYTVTGEMERTILARKPKTKQASKNSGVVESRLAFGGSWLNVMDRENFRQIQGYVRVSRSTTESFNVASYTRKTRSGSTVKVEGYSMNRTKTFGRWTPERGGDTHAAIFGKFAKDAPAIQARVAVELRRIVQRSAYDKRTGRIKSSLIPSASEAAA